ncbi:chaperone NapD [Pseudoxanthomonas sp.]|uniref:chaperone NapD n=1 Tax=Pseudoxanthomonas sp. TaxID=1871049 RepID=UPI00258964C9|nr:chaperone NapD [Pseudoxanthomonas sp.]MCR6685714.1 chaperone NapD [Pseudoxanthomonas sp.]
MNVPAHDEVHIASFVVQHRDDALPALVAAVAGHGDLELAVRGDTRSVVLCESADRHALMDRVDQLQAVPGVLNVLLVYHHAEPGHALDEPVDLSLSPASASGASA